MTRKYSSFAEVINRKRQVKRKLSYEIKKFTFAVKVILNLSVDSRR